MKKLSILFFVALLGLGSQVMGQAAYMEPDPNTIDMSVDSVTIFVDLSQVTDTRLQGTPGPLYMWTWSPADPTGVGGNGDWANSNPALEMTNYGPDLWGIKVVLTEFYGVTVQDIFDNDISFLGKLLDGTGDGFGMEDKTEDLMIAVDPPTSPQQKVFSFPADQADSVYITQNDIFTLSYDNSLEDKVTMQNVDDLYVYARAWDTDGTQYRPAIIAQVGNTPKLQMKNVGEGMFRWTIWPKDLFEIPDGKTLDYVRLQIMKPDLQSSDDAVDGTFEYYFRCN